MLKYIDDRYSIDADGNVYSHGVRLACSRKSNGYVSVKLHNGQGKAETRWVHHLVLEAFVGPRPKGYECRHLDGDPSNNRLDNLAWGTRQENAADRQRHGTASGPKKYTDEQVVEMRRMRASGAKYAEICDRFGVSKSNLSSIINGGTRG